VFRGGFFLKEQALILQMEKGLVVVTGCAHPGIVQILTTAQELLKRPLYFVLGGFHLFRTTCNTVKNVVGAFQTLQVKQVAPCHCSGASAMAQFQEAYQDSFYKIGTGTVLKIT
jgi:7,8-dihydropterin-6-yl-methyl-4-(beta-D-ribofuranosyl)aminobenzene 5'-phosphate synthase